MPSPESPPLLILPDGVLDLTAAVIRRRGETTALLPIELDLLRYLAARAGTLVPVGQLHAEVWGFSPRARTRAAYFAIRRLRQRLEADPRKPVVLVGTEGRGFALQARLADTIEDVRAADLHRLLCLLAKAGALVVLTGPAGVGKSSLLQQIALRLDAPVLDHDSSDGQPCASESPAAAQGDGLIILDHVPATQLAGWVQTLRADHPTRQILVSARHPPGLLGSQEHALARLSPDASARFLRQRLAARGARLPQPSPPLERLLELVGGLPLALDLVAERARSVPLATMAVTLELDLDALGGLPGDWRPARHRSLRACALHALSDVDPDLVAAGRRLSLLDGSPPWDLALAVLDPSAERSLGERSAGPGPLVALAGAGLATLDDKQHRITLDHGLRLALREHLSEGELAEVAVGLHRWWIQQQATLAQKQAAQVFGWMSTVTALALVGSCPEVGAPVLCDALALSYRVGLELDCSTLVEEARRRLVQPADRARVELAWAKLQTRALPRAEGLRGLARATVALEGLVPDQERAVALLFLAHNQLYADWIPQALVSLELASGLAADLTTRTRVRTGLASARRDSGDPRTALATAQQAVALGNRQDDLTARAGAMQALALAASDLGLREEAVQHATTSLHAVEHLVGTRLLLNSLFTLGNILRCADRYLDALGVMDRALDLAAAMRDGRLDPLVAMNRALLLLDMDQPAQAHQTLLRHIGGAVAVDDRLATELRVIGELARVRSGQAPIGLDLDRAQKSVLAHAAVPDRVIFLSWCAEIARAVGDRDRAKEAADACRSLVEGAGYGAQSEVGRALRRALEATR